jgi:hypothetical protein
LSGATGALPMRPIRHCACRPGAIGNVAEPVERYAMNQQKGSSSQQQGQGKQSQNKQQEQSGSGSKQQDQKSPQKQQQK